jgi:hypothetical protein
MQLLFMVITELGKYMGYYGNKGAAGEKGAGSGPNGCLMNYDTAAVNSILSANNMDSCSGTGDGSLDLDPSDPNFIRRSCEAIVMHNVFGDIVSNVDFSSSSNLGNLAATKTIYANLLTAAILVEPDVANYDGFKDFSECETYALTDTDELQRVFASYVENFYQ